MEANTIGEIAVETVQNIFFTVCILIAVVWIVNKIFSIIANAVFLMLGTYKDHHTFNITKGDKKRCQEISYKLNRNKAKILLNIIVTLIFNVICSIIANNLQIFF